MDKGDGLHDIALRSEVRSVPKVFEAYQTTKGKMLFGRIEDALESTHFKRIRGKVNLILTSPPFPLVTKKKYGNETGEAYLSWLASLAGRLSDLLAHDGSIVIEIGNAWEQGSPAMSTLPVEALLAFKKAAKLNLCQHVICHNPARLPSPAEWVNVRRIRLKDSFTHVWWLSRSKMPKADNRNVLNPYGKDMRSLLKTKRYNSGARPSGHVISEAGFLTNHGGSISASVLELEAAQCPEALLKYTGTSWDRNYRDYCAERQLIAHPARMQSSLAGFFVQFLTDKGDLVFDPFAGSNTTGAVSEDLGRRWLGVEADSAYIEGSRGRFEILRARRKKSGSGLTKRKK
ncbi:site-specific DNA-methyltransferase (cytosine-N4-specific) [Bradyrhizobium sp. USDA 4532]|uniref:DNA-methyltransferase n=1 Tax=unclassified Bradyrhizobium TaxID=2631580 RepID=UPI00209D0AE4|nr:MULTISPECIES: site-specific DNA-methyltransferase [unclassified Bradyrhizobium]MCP1829092.1 site-specific DNA-methyltransferase (cytosine-N4-specific) [Bradyrhizobium sp. USDA 4545]MCP1922201.1 site-specific DNA-methyltransferase (cytosine-N4-specific) [Bradyrhizobium sp. USDA 4532]